MADGDGTALLSLVPFSRVTGFLFPFAVDPAALFVVEPPTELLPLDPPPALPPLDPPPPPPWARAGAEAAMSATKIAAEELFRIEISYDLDKATLRDTFRLAGPSREARRLLKTAEG